MNSPSVPLRALLLTLFILLVQTSSTFAQDGLSTNEEVAIAFFKAGNTNPDFDLWARKSDKYKVVAPAFAHEYLQEEKQRLMRAWQAYNPRERSIEMKTSVSIHLKTKPKEDGTHEYWMNIAMPDMDPIYFPYNYLDYKFAIMPQKLETMTLHTLQEPQFELMRAEFENAMAGSADLYIQLIPTKAYMDQPYQIDEQDQWVLITDVASLALKSQKNGTALWSYTAPWYLSPVKKKLETLYTD